MDDIQLKIKEDSGDSSFDCSREEEFWTHKNQAFFVTIIEQCCINSKLHGIAGRRNKKIYTYVSVPLISLPIIMSALTPQINNSPWLSSTFMISIGLMNTISAFINWGRKAATHLEYENRYQELADNITSELVKKKKYRVQFDLYLEKTKAAFGNLNKNAPII